MALALLTMPVLAQTATPKMTECYCTDRHGGRIELGQRICLIVDGRMFMAQCQMSLNVPMWRDLGEGCATSALTIPTWTTQPALISMPQPALP